MVVAYTRLNVKIVVTHAGITTGEDGASHQANEDIAIMRALPNMTVIVPADVVETERAIRAAVEFYGPMYIRLSRPKTPIIYSEQNNNFKIGKGIILSQGTDLTIIACGTMVSVALEAAVNLKTSGINARVVDLHTIKPLDTDLIVNCAKETGAILTVEEHSVIGGLGGAVAEVLVENYPIPMARVGLHDVFGESGKPEELLIKYGLTPLDVERTARSLLGRKH
jgi:transketolase